MPLKTLEETLNTWQQEPKEAAQRLIEYYGRPAEYSDSRLVWNRTQDGWKRSILVNELVHHEFPAPHNDYLEQFIDYKVPVDRYSDLARYDGSVIVERTKGEISARCGGTSMNFVAVNLAHDIIAGKRNVDEARQEYSRLYAAYQNGEKPAYTTAFQFPVPSGSTADPDVKTL